MSHYRRVRTGNTFFFTLVAHHRRPILCHPRIRDALRLAIQNLRQTYPFSIDGWVLLPDHLHCIWTLPDGPADFSTRWSLIKRSVARLSRNLTLDPDEPSASACERRESTIWQRRFREHLIRDDVDFERHLDYIHFNPVRHGYAGRAIDWPYSTMHRYVKEGRYPSDWCGGANPGWAEFE